MWPLTWAVIAGTLPGVFTGALVRVGWLPNPDHFKFFAASASWWESSGRLWYRRRGHHPPFLVHLLRAAGLYGGRGRPQGHPCELPGWRGVLAGDRSALPESLRGP